MLVHEWQNRIGHWAEERKLIEKSTSTFVTDRAVWKAYGQFTKLIEEAGELGGAIDAHDWEETEDAIGDCVVVLTIICLTLGLNLDECMEAVWKQIKDRKGKMVGNVFVKEN
jgi:NTP pyrophosphatase (non-canonical NTP hydrolase)